VILDYHMHLRGPAPDGGEGPLDHRVEAIEPYVEAARAAGVDEIGFTEHVYYFRQTRPLWHVPYHTERCVFDLEPYVTAILEAKQRGLPLKLGLEVDYEPGREEETRDLLAPYPWDFLLGSIHFIEGRGVDGEPRLVDDVGVDATWLRYFEELAAAAASGLFDSLAHPDLAKVFGDRPERGLEEELHEQAVEAIAAAGVAVEVSTAGLRKPVGELYPDPHLLGLCRAHGVPVTLASDAHEAGLVGADFDRALDLLRGAGYETITAFDERRPRQVPFDG
jgi:histidinol-phosphatase (PHP family)